jgi:hypothetical protein
MILLDSGSTIGATIANPDLLTDTKEVDKTIHMATNAGIKELTQQGQIKGFGPAWYDPDFAANIFGLSHMIKQGYHIKFDSEIENAFVATKDGETVKFEATPEGLYGYMPQKSYLEYVSKSKPEDYEVQMLVSTVKDNMEGYTKREIEGAMKARKFLHAIGCPSVDNLKHIIRSNLIKNCPVTTKDVKLAEEIFGADIASLKGKTTRQTPKAVVDELIEIPQEIKDRDDLTLCMDLMYVNKMPVFTSIDKTFRFRAAVNLANRTKDELFKALDAVLRQYNKAGYRIESIHCDQEFRPLMDQVADELDVEMNYTTTDEHVPEAERNNRTIKERVRAAYHGLPFKAIPKVMLRKLVAHETKLLNFLPAKGGVSAYLSPYSIITGKSVDHDKELAIPFGAYVQGCNEPQPTNTNAPRTLDCIYLGPVKNKQGGHELLDLSSGRVITRPRVKELPMTDMIMRAVESMAEADGIKSLKFAARDGTPFEPRLWIEEEDDEDEDDDSSYSDDSSSSSESSSDSDSEDEEDSDDDDYPPDLARRSDSESDSDSEDDDDDTVTIDRYEIRDLLADNRRYYAELNANPSDDDPAGDAEPQEDPPDPPEAVDAHPAGVSVSDIDSQETSSVRRSTRERHEPTRFDPAKGLTQLDYVKDLEYCHNIMLAKHVTKGDNANTIEYTTDIAGVAARFIHFQNELAMSDGHSFGQQYIVHKGLKIFGDRGRAAAKKEMAQLHDRQCFYPIDIAELTPTEKRKAQESLMFLTEKRDKTVQARTVYNGKPTREWHDKDESASPTASLESIFLTAIIDAKEGRDVMSADIPNAFIQTAMPVIKEGEDRVIMKLTGILLDLLVELSPELYGPYVVLENGKRVLYLQVLRALYGMLVAALLWYRQFRQDLEQVGFEFNPYDPCVANRMVEGKQQTVRFHVDDLMSSHANSQVNDAFLGWLNEMYGNHGEVKATRGKIHDYLGMVFDFSMPGEVVISMIDYMKKIVDEFP